MSIGTQKIINDIRQGQIATVYALDGDENYYLDQLADFFENHFLPPAERDFNLSVFYGKDAQLEEVINACRRFPMFAQRQVVLVKDAAQLKGLNELAAYVESPSPTTVFVLEHRGKKIDQRSKLLKLLKAKGVHFTAEKIKDDQVPQWVHSYGKASGLEIGQTACELLATFLGNDLQKLVNEVEKVRLNLAPGEALTDVHIQRYIGISKEYNLFELPEVFANGQQEKFSNMVSFFLSHPKQAPMPLIIGSFYAYFNQLYLTHFALHLPPKEAAGAMKTWPSRVPVLRQTAQRWPLEKVEWALLILGKYSAATVGIDHHANDPALLKEMIGKLRLLQPMPV